MLALALPVFGGTTVVALFEEHVEVAIVLVAAFADDLRNGEVGIPEQLAGSRQPDILHHVNKVFVHKLLNGFSHVVRMKVKMLGNGGQRNRFVVQTDIVDDVIGGDIGGGRRKIEL